MTLRRGCEDYGIRLEFRPPGRAHFNVHIERLIDPSLMITTSITASIHGAERRDTGGGLPDLLATKLSNLRGTTLNAFNRAPVSRMKPS